jgi:pilus assembly protein CpaE
MSGSKQPDQMRAIILSDEAAIRTSVRQSVLKRGLQCPPEAALSLAQSAQALAGSPADLFIVALSPSPERALATLAELRGRTKAGILAVGPMTDAKLILHTLRAGADEYLDEGDLESEIQGALARVRSGRSATVFTGRIIALAAPSGGTGTSTLAVNLAAALAREHNSALLVDLQLQTGDLSALLDLKPAHTLSDLCQNAGRLDRVMVEGSLASHTCGVRLLAAPRTSREAALVTAAGVRSALELTRQMFPFLVLDLNNSFRDEQVQSIRLADDIVLVLRLDFTCLRNTRRLLVLLEQLGISRERVRLVVNCHGRAKEVPAAKAEEALEHKIFHYVPDDPKTINRANNNGVPVILDAPAAKVSRSILQLAQGLSAAGRAR